jgi:hypothetical protein
MPRTTQRSRAGGPILQRKRRFGVETLAEPTEAIVRARSCTSALDWKAGKEFVATGRTAANTPMT